MKIIDKTNDTWKIGDKVQTADGKTGLIQQSKDNFYAIVRTNDKHWGEFDNGLVYDINSYISKLQMNNPEFHKVNDNDNNEEWRPGDFVKNLNGEIGLIIYDNYGNVCILATEGNYAFNTATSLIATENTSLSEFQRSFTGKWHKVPSTLILGE